MNTVKRLFQYIKPYRKQLLLGFLAMLVVAGIQLLVPYLAGKVLFDDALGGKGNRALLNLVAIGVIALVLTKG
jgi:ABC-type multidrug transport system fused ATPase/permease subunit